MVAGSLRRHTSLTRPFGISRPGLKDLLLATSSHAPGADATALPAAGREGKEEALVQAMFDRVAPRYDLANAVLSLGQDAHWRRVVARAARPSGRTFLDVAAGPGNVAHQLVAHGARHVTALDLSYNMLAEGARRGLPDVDSGVPLKIMRKLLAPANGYLLVLYSGTAGRERRARELASLSEDASIPRHGGGAPALGRLCQERRAIRRGSFRCRPIK